MKNPLSIESAARRHVVQIQQQSTTQDGLGGQIEVWTTVRTTWAKIVYLAAGSKENYQSGAFSSQVTHIITIVATPVPPIKPGMRIVFGSHVYLIQPFDDVQLQGVKLNLQCIEIAGSQA
jgi:SPP1 family predicted phage head-tail adaptor